MDREAAINDLRLIARTFDEAVNSSPDGVPAGHLYAVAMEIMTLELFEMIMAALVAAGRVRKVGLLYYPRKGV